MTAKFFPVSIYTNFFMFIGYGYHNSVLIFTNLNLNRLTLPLWEDLSLLITGGGVVGQFDQIKLNMTLSHFQTIYSEIFIKMNGWIVYGTEIAYSNFQVNFYALFVNFRFSKVLISIKEGWFHIFESHLFLKWEICRNFCWSF